MKSRRWLKDVGMILILISIVMFFYPIISNDIIRNEMDYQIESFNKFVENLPSEVKPAERPDETFSAVPTSISSETESESYAETPIRTQPAQQDAPNGGEEETGVSTVLSRLYRDSVDYNERLKQYQDLNKGFTDSVLNLYDYGLFSDMYGYLQADAIGLSVPIYLGATDDNMAYGAAHMSNTSLPVGGESTHCVLVGHTGFIGRTFFDDIRQLKSGDTVVIRNYFDTLVYKVISYKEIGETETNDLYIEKDRDLLTLITCTRMGKARYEVICERV